ncbi:MAG: hypothetical protein GF419_10810 [Ignavibacteriales bacterium]|nr:hypothetical protein [Ignavibacteriales bacterium]
MDTVLFISRLTPFHQAFVAALASREFHVETRLVGSLAEALEEARRKPLRFAVLDAVSVSWSESDIEALASYIPRVVVAGFPENARLRRIVDVSSSCRFVSALASIEEVVAATVTLARPTTDRRGTARNSSRPEADSTDETDD